MSMWKLGHRGACGHAPENTLMSVRKALEFGVDGFEFDIQLSKEGEPVVIHDDTLERTTNGTGKVANYTVAQLQTFDAGQGEKIPTLRNLLDAVDKRCKLFIELKAEGCEQAVAVILRAYVEKHGWNWEHFYICAFDHPQLVAIRKIEPNLRISALIAGIPVSLAAIGEEAGAWSFNPCIHHISKALVDDAHKRGMKVFTWTVNKPEHIAKARALGVDGIFSDFPDRL